MKTIDIYYQGEGVRGIEHLELDGEQSFGDLKARIVSKHGLTEETVIFIEDADEPIDEVIIIREYALPHGLKAHVHRCHHVQVSVTFNGETVERSFGPSATIARVKNWAAEHKFGMNKEEASEHVLQIVGTHDRPSPGVHVGSLTQCPHCHLAFDLVADQRVNGASETVA